MKLQVAVIAQLSDLSERLVRELSAEGYGVTALMYKQGLLSELSRLGPDVVLFYVSVPDKALVETIRLINHADRKPVIVLSDDLGNVSTESVVKAGVSAYIVDGYKPGRMKTIMGVALARFDEYQNLSHELYEVKVKLEDRKVIDKAKGILMQLKGFNEDQAYKLMRKLAMENNKRLVEIAQGVIHISKETK